MLIPTSIAVSRIVLIDPVLMDRHGRDNSLRVWRLDLKDEEIVDKTLPVDIQTSAKEGNEPWLIHSLTVNALNFCPFALCFIPARKHEESKLSAFPGAGESSSKSLPDSQMLLAVPNALNTGGMDIFHLPSEKRVSVIPPDPSVNTGMVMAVQLFCSRYGDLYVVSGYEDGRAIIHVRRGYMNTESGSHGESRSEWDWELIYMSKPHSQPILSLEVSPEQNNYFLTSSADAIIAKHPIPIPPPPAAQGRGAAPAPESSPIKIANTKHSGQQGLRIRSDEKIFVTAGWDFKTRVYSCKTMKELAVLKWHKEGCYAVALADVSVGFDSDGSLPSTDKPTEGPAKETCPSRALTVSPQLGGSLAEIKLQRSRKAERTHWVAAGSKDGKISLWDIY